MEVKETIAYQNVTMHFDMNFHTMSKKNVAVINIISAVTLMMKQVPAAAVAPGNIAVVGGAISKPLILLLKKYKLITIK